MSGSTTPQAKCNFFKILVRLQAERALQHWKGTSAILFKILVRTQAERALQYWKGTNAILF